MDQVVCINKGRWFIEGQEYTAGQMPVYGAIYTIVGATFFPKHGFKLAECADPALHDLRSGYWSATAFRPVRKTSIEVFKEMLNPTPEQVLDEVRAVMDRAKEKWRKVRSFE